MNRLKIKLFCASLVIVMIACSALSFVSVAENHRWTLSTLNPLNGIESIAFVVSYFSGMGAAASYTITAVILLAISSGLYFLMLGFAQLLRRR